MVGGRAKQAVSIEEEEKGCGPTSPGFWDTDDHVHKHDQDVALAFLAEQRRIAEPRHGCVSGIFELGDFLGEENRKCHFELQFVFVVVGLVEKHFMTSEH